MSRLRFGATALDIAAHLAIARAAELARAMADKARELFPGLSVERRDEAVAIKGRNLKSRLLTDAPLRRPGEWLKGGLPWT